MNIHFRSLDIDDIFEFANTNANYCIKCCFNTYYIKGKFLACYCYTCKHTYSAPSKEYVILLKTILV
jgi:hypothetical protein